MVSLKVDMFLQFIASSGNKFLSLVVAKKCLKMFMIQMGSLSDFDLLILVFLVLKKSVS